MSEVYLFIYILNKHGHVVRFILWSLFSHKSNNHQYKSLFSLVKWIPIELSKTSSVKIYTKTFGGKIWENLHRVSPYNISHKIFKIASLKIFRKYLWTVPCAKRFPKQILNGLLLWFNWTKFELLLEIKLNFKRFS